VLRQFRIVALGEAKPEVARTLKRLASLVSALPNSTSALFGDPIIKKRVTREGQRRREELT
jgi:hypothetical protein